MNRTTLFPPLSRSAKVFFRIFFILALFSFLHYFFNTQSESGGAGFSGLSMPVFFITIVPLTLITLTAMYCFLSVIAGLFKKEYFSSDKKENIRLIIARIVILLPTLVILLVGTYLSFYSFFNYIGIHIIF